MYIMATRKHRRQRKSRGNKRRGNRRISMKGGRPKPETNDGTVDSETVQKILVVAYGKSNDSGGVNKIIKVINVDKTNYADDNAIMTACDKTLVQASEEIKTDLNIGQETNIEDNAISIVSSFNEFKTRYDYLEAFDNTDTKNKKITVYCLAGVIKNYNGKRTIVKLDDGTPLLNFAIEFSTARNDMFTWNDNGNGNDVWEIKTQ